MSEAFGHLRVLVPVDPLAWKGGFGADYIQGLVAAFEAANAEVVMSEMAFERPCSDFAMVLVNWPEWLQKALKIDAVRMFSLLAQWRECGCKTGIVLHNDRPHEETKENRGLYEGVKGHFDFAVHLASRSVITHSDWASRHYVVPHPQLLLGLDVMPAFASTGILVLGAMRSQEEKVILHRFAWAGRLRGMPLFIGSFRSFPEPKARWKKFLRWVYWRFILRVQWNFGYVDGETLQRWQSQCRFMLIHRTDSHLNSAIPYTAMSNGLIPIGLGPGNVGEVLRQYQIPVLKSMGWMDVWRYVGRIRSSAVQVDFGQFERDHSLESVAAGLKRVLKGESLI